MRGLPNNLPGSLRVLDLASNHPTHGVGEVAGELLLGLRHWEQRARSAPRCSTGS